MMPRSLVAAANRAALATPRAPRLPLRRQPAPAQRLARQLFSTRPALLTEKTGTDPSVASQKTSASPAPTGQQQQQQQTAPPPNPQYPKFSLDGLGLSKNMKIFVYVLIGVWGTFETYFYGRAIHRWWTGRNADKAQ